ncbi:hypothetical protein GQX73_g4175 [Xylaria multiplex]|uniref:Uncharacterized protein n=1 Tax=Xylaria multiplex TaxID=323545 RepID=A0A7C8ISU6_9PEZI|nr:hypothetical protein GQX73_g4175 [Xylaria multiplex]
MATPGKNKTNFKTYEASTRLLAAVIATNNIKLDYAELAKHVGGGATKDAINHRLRPIKQLAKMQASCLSKGEDPGELPVDKGALASLVGEGTTAFALQHRMRAAKQLAREFTAELERRGNSSSSPAKEGEIHKLFGESTPDGIEWQFRSIKNLGKSQQAAVQKGENPATLLVAGTPSGRKRGPAASTPGSGATARTPGTGARGHKRNMPVALPALDSSEENGDNDSDYNDAETPSKRASKRAKTAVTTATPARVNGSVTAPTATPARATADTPTPAVSAAVTSAARAPNGSIFGNGTRAPAAMAPANGSNNGSFMIIDDDEQHDSPAAKPVSKPAIIKKEFTTGMNPFIDADGFGDFEDGEI